MDSVFQMKPAPLNELQAAKQAMPSQTPHRRVLRNIPSTSPRPSPSGRGCANFAARKPIKRGVFQVRLGTLPKGEGRGEVKQGVQKIQSSGRPVSLFLLQISLCLLFSFRSFGAA